MAATQTRPTGRAGLSGAAPAPRTRTSGQAFTRITGVFLVLAAILWLIPSLFAIKTSLTDNGVAALGAQEILTDVSPTLESYLGLLQQGDIWNRSEEHTSELQSRGHLVCRLLLEKKNNPSTRLQHRITYIPEN